MATRGRARLAFAQGLSVWVLEAPAGFSEPEFHAHHALQLTACLAGTMSLRHRDGTLAGEVLAVAPDHSHRLAAEGLLAFVFVEPESRAGRALAARLFGAHKLAVVEDPALHRAVAPLRDALDAPLPHEAMIALGWAALAALIGEAEPPLEPDPRIGRIVEHAAAHASLTRAAEAAGVFLSESRLRHLFVEQTGLAYKTYVLWLRLVRAVQLYAEGASLTEAAHAAGFADSAHFSRVFKRTFGAAATTLTRL